MTYRKALNLITLIRCNSDQGMNYCYDLSIINKYKLTLTDKKGEIRTLRFSLKKGIKKIIDVDFICEDFQINFPLLKQVKRFKFNIYDFTMMLNYGIKSNKIQKLAISK